MLAYALYALRRGRALQSLLDFAMHGGAARSKKELFLNLFLRGSLEIGQARRFYMARGRHMWRPSVVGELERLKALGFEVVIVTASPDEIARPFAEAVGTKLLASKIINRENRLEVAFDCKGENKPVAIRAAFRMEGRECVVFGNSPHDDPMGSMATRGYHVVTKHAVSVRK